MVCEEVAPPVASDDSPIEDIVGEHKDKDDLFGKVDIAIAGANDLDDAFRKVFVEYLKAYRGQLPVFSKQRAMTRISTHANCLVILVLFCIGGVLKRQIVLACGVC